LRLVKKKESFPSTEMDGKEKKKELIYTCLLVVMLWHPRGPMTQSSPLSLLTTWLGEHAVGFHDAPRMPRIPIFSEVLEGNKVIRGGNAGTSPSFRKPVCPISALGIGFLPIWLGRK
jgi:hypothetical protein